MSFLAPMTAAIAAALVIPALVALYFLKLRRKEVRVPTTLLWRKAVHDMEVNAPFQRLRRNLLLFLQLLLLAALLFAMARPTMDATAEPGQQVVILIDRSASMSAADGEPTRLEEAKERARRLIDRLDGSAMVVSFAEGAQVVQRLTDNRSQLRSAVEGIEPTDQRSRLGPALQLVEPYALETEATGEEGPRIYVVSDGRVHMPGEEEAMSLPGMAVEYVQVGSEPGEAINNVGFVAFSARRDFERPEQVRVFARLANFNREAVRTGVELRIDGRVRAVQEVSVPGVGEDGTAGEETVEFEFARAEEGLVEVRHDHEDLMEADDSARLRLASAERVRVLLVSEGNAFLERVLQSVGARELVTMRPEAYEQQDPERLRRGGWDAEQTGRATTEAGFDAIVFDGYAPEAVPTVDSLYFGAVPPMEGLAIRAAREGAPSVQAVLDWSRDHVLLRYVGLDDVVLQEPGRLVVPTDAQVLATGQTGPLLAEVRREGVRHVMASFDVMQTNWPLYVSFPVFMSNTVQVLGMGGMGDEAGVMFRTGQVATVPVRGDEQRVRYDGPRGVTGSVRRREAVLPGFERVGLYETGDEVEEPYGQLPVNLLDALESDLRTAGQLQVGAQSVEGQRGESAVQREIWPWFVWAGLAVLLIEWMVYTQRMRV